MEKKADDNEEQKVAAPSQNKEGNKDVNATLQKWIKEQTQRPKFELDMVFILDCTGSMNPYIKSARDNINHIVDEISNDKDISCDLRCALICYRDFPPQDETFVTQITPFTSLPLTIKSTLSKMNATGYVQLFCVCVCVCLRRKKKKKDEKFANVHFTKKKKKKRGGDMPECLTKALWDLRYSLTDGWRNDSIKVAVVITDAPPHGIETHMSDGFPDGDPLNVESDEMRPEGCEASSMSSKQVKSDTTRCINVLDVIRSIRDDLNLSIYSVACEPSVSTQSDFARDFLEYISECTNGKYLPLTNATLLPSVIIGSIKEQVVTDQLVKHMDELISTIQRNYAQEYGETVTLSEQEIGAMITKEWTNAGLKSCEVSIGSLYRKTRSRVNVDLLLNEQRVKSLQDFKKQCTQLPRLNYDDFRHLSTDTPDTRSSSPPYHFGGDMADRSVGRSRPYSGRGRGGGRGGERGGGRGGGGRGGVARGSRGRGGH
ncbi:hypothetical protein RFI_00994, partial [Reticulomyxa filosa]